MMNLLPQPPPCPQVWLAGVNGACIRSLVTTSCMWYEQLGGHQTAWPNIHFSEWMEGEERKE